MASSYVIIILLFLTFCQLVLQNEIPGDAGDFCLLPRLPLQVDQRFKHLVGSGDDPVGELVGVFCAVIACMEIGFVLQCDRKGVCHSERRSKLSP